MSVDRGNAPPVLTSPRSESPLPSLPRFSTTPVLLCAGAMFALEIAVAARYGLHRDELYFLACSRHLAWGYVDQPPMVPALARLATALFGASALGLRIIPALAGAGTVVVAGLSARELGGRRSAQLIAGVAAATTPQALATSHTLSTAAFDTFFWSVIVLLVVRMCRTSDTRWWVAIGAVVGVALLNKLNVAFLVFGVLAGLLLARRARLLMSRWLLAGAVLGFVIFLPDLVWNATHNWAQLAMLHSLHRENSGIGASLSFIPSQLVVVGPVLAFVWIPGLRRVLRHPAGRPLGLAYLVLLVLFAVTGGKSYYLAGMYYILFAGGGLLIEERLAGDPATWGARRIRGLFVAVAVGTLVALPLTLPVLPMSTLPAGSWESKINKDLSATVGWKEFAAQVAGIADTLPPAERTRLVIFTGDYGAAGAIDRYGRAYRLPGAISGHNNYWWWGPGPAPDRSTTIAVDLPQAYLLTIFTDVRLAGTVSTPHGVWTEERGDPIFICTGQRLTWMQAWPAARHYG